MSTKARKKRKHQRKTDGYWSADHGLGEWTPEDKAEKEERQAEILAAKLKPPESISGHYFHRPSLAVYRALGHGAHRKVKTVSSY